MRVDISTLPPPKPDYLPIWQKVAELGLPPGDIVEFGCSYGGTTRQLADLWPRKRVWAFDTFEGTPIEDHTPKYDAAHIAPGSLSFTDRVNIAKLFSDHPNITPVAGRFAQTLRVVPRGTEVCLAYIDCNLYHSCKQAYAWLRGRLVDGGYLLVDDYAGFAGVRKATDEFLTSVGIEPGEAWDGSYPFLFLGV